MTTKGGSEVIGRARRRAVSILVLLAFMASAAIVAEAAKKNGDRGGAREGAL